MFARQELTRDWWDSRSGRYEIFISEIGLSEVCRGDPSAASARLQLLENIPVLELSDTARELAHELVRRVPLPPKAAADALHIALATVSGMDYLLTWNFTPIANATLRKHIDSTCKDLGLQMPIICTPEELKSAFTAHVGADAGHEPDCCWASFSARSD